MAFVSARPAATAVAMALLAAMCLWSSSGRLESQTPPAFVLPVPGRVASQRLSSQQFSVAVNSAPEEALSARLPSDHGVLGACASAMGLAALAALSARRRQNDASRASKVAMMARNRFRPAAKGMKPMIHRKETRDIMKDQWEGFNVNKGKNLEFMEKVVRQQLHGKMQFQFTSEHFVDEQPLMQGMAGQKRDVGVNWAHNYDDVFYVRKYLEPTKFKKLAIASWEMPENYTRAVTLRELVDAGVQYGHKSNQWNPKMLKYLYADNDGTHIFDLVQTAAGLNRACYYCMEAAARGAEFIMIGTKAQARPIVKEKAEESGVHYCDLRFVGGIVSNFAVIQKSIKLMKKLREDKEQGAWGIFGPNQRMRNQCKLNRLTKKYHGIEDMTRLPDICIFVDEAKERNPISEMTRIGVPCVGLVDSNNDPQFIDLPIPGNSSGSRSIELVIGKLAEAIKKGKMIREQTQEGNREAFPKEWDPWIFSRDRMRMIRRRSKRQPWMKAMYGSYENWKKCHPFGAIPSVVPFHDFKWNDFWEI